MYTYGGGGVTYLEKGYEDVRQERPSYHTPSATPQDPLFSATRPHFNQKSQTKSHRNQQNITFIGRPILIITSFIGCYNHTSLSVANEIIQYILFIKRST